MNILKSTLACLAVSATCSQAAFFFPSVTANGSSFTAGAGTGTVQIAAAQTSVTGSFDADEIALSSLDLVNFTFTSTGSGSINVSLDHTDNGGVNIGFFRFTIEAVGEVSSIDYTFDYANGLLSQGNSTVVLVGARGNTTVDDAVLNYVVNDVTDSTAIDLTGSNWRTTNITGDSPQTPFRNPTLNTLTQGVLGSYDADGVVTADTAQASLLINEDEATGGNVSRAVGLGFSDNGVTSTIYGSVSGSLTANDFDSLTTDDELGAGSILQLSLNGQFVTVPVPEPTTFTILGMSLFGFVLRRNRR